MSYFHSKLITFSVRCHTNCDCSSTLFAHKTLIDNWLSYRQLDISQSSFGIHRDASKPHYHYHLVVTGTKDKSPPLALLKYDMQKERFSFDTSYTFIKDRNMSIKWESVKDHSVNSLERFLQYPLKEGEIYDACNIDVEKLTMQAKAEYLAIKIKLAKDKLKADKEKQRKFNLIEHLDKTAKFPYFQYDIYKLGLLFYQKDPNRPQIPNVFKEIDEWRYSRGHVTYDELITQYRPKCDMKTSQFIEEFVNSPK